MFFISGKFGNMYDVTDTRDGISERYSIQEILSYKRAGSKIRGIRIKNDGKVAIFCKSENVLDDFIASVSIILSKVKLLYGNINVAEAEKRIRELAMRCGVIDTSSDIISIDLRDSLIYIDSDFYKIVLCFKTGELVKKLSISGNSLEVFRKDLFKVCNSSTVVLGDGLSIKMRTVLDELIFLNYCKGLSIDMEEYIAYMGLSYDMNGLKLYLVTPNCVLYKLIGTFKDAVKIFEDCKLGDEGKEIAEIRELCVEDDVDCFDELFDFVPVTFIDYFSKRLNNGAEWMFIWEEDYADWNSDVHTNLLALKKFVFNRSCSNYKTKVAGLYDIYFNPKYF